MTGITFQDMGKNGWLWTIRKLMELVLNPLIREANDHHQQLEQHDLILDSLNRRLAKLEGVKIEQPS